MAFETLPEPLDRIYPAGIEWTVQEYDGVTDEFRVQVNRPNGVVDLMEVPGDVVRDYLSRAMTEEESHGA